MHIGMLTACYAPVVNGVTQLVALYEKHLTAAGHQVTVFTLGKPVPGEDASRVIRSPGFNLGQTGYRVALGYSSVAQRKLQTVDVIHSHHPLMGLEFARRYGRAPVVFTNHTRYDLYLNNYGHVPQWLADQMMGFAWRRLAGMADAVIAPSTSIARLLRETGVKVPIEVIENGVEVARFKQIRTDMSRADLHIPQEAIVFAYVGRIAPEKNIRRLLEEFRLVTSRRDAYLLVVGGGPMLDEARRMSAYDLAGRTRFVGPAEPEKVPSFLALADAFVSASVTEVHPLSVIEALAAGLPVVAYDAPGMNDIIENDVSGLLVSDSPGHLAWAMSQMAGKADLRSKLAMDAKRAGQRYDIQSTVERTLATYRRLLREGTGRLGTTDSSGSAPGQLMSSWSSVGDPGKDSQSKGRRV